MAITNKARDMTCDWCNGPNTAGSALTQLMKNLPKEYAASNIRKRLPSG